MTEVEEAMIHFQLYVQNQKDDNKPLYKWAKFDGYRAISRTLVDLDEAAAKLKPTYFPAPCVKTYLDRATQFSLSVSHIAVFVMGVMSEKSANCIDEFGESTLSAEGKVNALTLITNELQRLLRHCVRATDRVYAALDLLRKALLIDKSHQNSDISIVKDLLTERETRSSTSRKGWIWTLTGIVVGAASSATIGLTMAHLYGPSGFDLALKANPEGMHAQVMDLVHRTQTVTTLTGEMYSIKLQDLEKRYKELEDASESHGLRIDNLVEALGVPNDEGTYYSSSAPKLDCQVPDDIRSYIRKISDDADRQSERLQNEMEKMRKNVNRMDIRLMKRLDKIEHYGL
jgi:hypothetical protein